MQIRTKFGKPSRVLGLSGIAIAVSLTLAGCPGAELVPASPSESPSSSPSQSETSDNGGGSNSGSNSNSGSGSSSSGGSSKNTPDPSFSLPDEPTYTADPKATYKPIQPEYSPIPTP
jgi:hypothetical protein